MRPLARWKSEDTPGLHRGRDSQVAAANSGVCSLAGPRGLPGISLRPKKQATQSGGVGPTLVFVSVGVVTTIIVCVAMTRLMAVQTASVTQTTTHTGPAAYGGEGFTPSNPWTLRPTDPCWDTLVFGRDPTSNPLDAAAVKWMEPRFGPTFFGTTQRMCRRARSNAGDELVLLALASKLAKGQCTSIVIFGGSVTTGVRSRTCTIRNDTISKKAYSYVEPLLQTLNTRFPCGGRGHQIHSFSSGSVGSDRHFQLIRSRKHHRELLKADLVLIEAAINDVGQMKSPGNVHPKLDNPIAYWTEGIARLLRFMYPITPVVWLEASWRCFDPGTRGCHPAADMHEDGAAAHLRVLEYYDIPQLSMLRMLGPHREAKLDFLRNGYFCDGGHPSYAGNRLLASMISYTLRDIVGRMDAIAAEIEWHGIPVRAELPKETLLLPDKLSTINVLSVLDFSDKRDVERSIVKNGWTGWAFDTDMPNKKPPLLMSSKPGSCVLLHLGTPPNASIRELDFAMMHSYEHFGVAIFTALEHERCAITNSELERDPGLSFEPNWRAIASARVNCTWGSHTSQRSTRVIAVRDDKQRRQCTKYMRVCFQHSGNPSPGSLKLKLFGVSAYS